MNVFEGDPAPGRHEVPVSPKERFAAQEAAGERVRGGWGDHRAESKQVSDQLSLLLINTIFKEKKVYFNKTVVIFMLRDSFLSRQ